VDWKTSKLANLPCLPANGQFITNWNNQDHAFHTSVNDLRQLLGLPVISLQSRNPVQTEEIDYLTVMIDMNSRLSLSQLDPGGTEANQESPHLIHIYIPLNAIETVPIEGEIVPKGETRQYSVIEVIAKHTRLVLLGGPGTGKSTVLKYVTWY